jgi:hypothetical protein
MYKHTRRFPPSPCRTLENVRRGFLSIKLSRRLPTARKKAVSLRLLILCLALITNRPTTTTNFLKGSVVFLCAYVFCRTLRKGRQANYHRPQILRSPCGAYLGSLCSQGLGTFTRQARSLSF